MVVRQQDSSVEVVVQPAREECPEPRPDGEQRGRSQVVAHRDAEAARQVVAKPTVKHHAVPENGTGDEDSTDQGDRQVLVGTRSARGGRR